MMLENVILQGTVGSTAYGLAREGSDVDSLGVFLEPSVSFFSLRSSAESVVARDPDITLHELRKYISLALKCNPTILELLWLPPDLYRITSEYSDELISMRSSFLSESHVRNAYGGYAMQQVKRLQNRNAEGKEGFSSDLKKRTAKHARHCFRLLDQGRQLLTTGEMQVRVTDPERYWAFDDYSVEQIVDEFEKENEKFNEALTVLPERPNFQLFDQWLIAVRIDEL